MSLDILKLSIPKIVEALRSKKLSSKELTSFYLNRVKKLSKLNSYITIMESEALKKAEALDHKGYGVGDSLLKGIPVSIKDIFMFKGFKTTCASKALSNYVSVYDSTVADRLNSAGAVMLGKNNMDEFAMGSSNEHSYYGPVLNPWDEKKVAGGSSGGSAVAVSAALSQISYGTDTGGSVRLPASYTGICALKPTYGRVSRYGVVAFSSSLDQPGPMARNIEDLAIAYDAVAGRDFKDSTTSQRKPENVYLHLEKNIFGKQDNYQGKSIGIPKDFLKDGVSLDVIKSFDEVCSELKKAGFTFKDIDLPNAKHALDVYYIISTGEASSNLARYDGIRYGHRATDFVDLKSLYKASRSESFGDEVKRRIALGTFVLSAGYYDEYFSKAAKVRSLIRQDFDNAYKNCDMILMPTAPTTAFNIGEKISDPLTMYLSDIFTVPVNLASIPSLAFPCGLTSQGMPVGMQLLGKHFDELSLFEVASVIQHKRPDWFNMVSIK